MKRWYILCHGFHGRPAGMRPLEEMIDRRDPDALVLNCKSLSFFDMGMGMEFMATKIVAEIRQFYDENVLEKERRELILIGHSMGGLLLRRAITLFFRGEHSWIVPGTYVSVATPHLGVDRSSHLRQVHPWFAPIYSLGIQSVSLIAFLLPNLFDTIMQMLVRDGENQYLRQLCDEENLGSLSKFQRRLCIASADGIDMNVPLYSSHIGVTEHEKNERVSVATNDEQKNKLWLDNHQREMKSKLDQLDWTRITLRFNVPWHLYPFAHPIILQNTLLWAHLSLALQGSL